MFRLCSVACFGLFSFSLVTCFIICTKVCIWSVSASAFQSGFLFNTCFLLIVDLSAFLFSRNLWFLLSRFGSVGFGLGSALLCLSTICS